MKKLKHNRGITLIALIITIIILLILAGISIKALTNTGLFGKANEAKIRTEISRIEEEANLIYLDLVAGKYTENIDDISISSIANKLTEEGCQIEQIATSEEVITGISLDKSSTSISSNGTETIKVTYEGCSYYAIVYEKYYKITLTNSGVKIDRTASEIDKTSNVETLTALSSDENYVTVKSIEGNIITLQGGSTVGTSTITVSYGSYSKTCDVSVVVKPTEDSVANSSTSFSTAYGRIDVIWLSGTSNTITTTPNEPILTSNEESMTPVIWDSDNNIVETTSSDNNWYSYTPGTGTADNTSSKWANAKTANDSYFVWIPRYAYRITYYESQSSTTPTGYYDGWGMWNAVDGTVKYALDSGVETVDYNGEKYIVHPAFETNLDNGGWSSDLSGFWVAKFEMSGTGGSDLVSTYGSPMAQAQYIGPQYTVGRQATYGYDGTTDPDDGNTSYMNSHMMKNSEWGAVAYLTQSKYGRNGTEITINDNTSFYRGGGSGTAYITNANQSTTGNVYGIYDMSGGGYERVAAFNGIDSYGRLSSSKWTEATGLTVDSSSTKYATKYNSTGNYTGNELVYNYGKVGDATKEVNTGGIYDEDWESYCSNWFSDYGRIIHSEYPFFNRGGRSNSQGDEAGIFMSGNAFGSGWYERFSYGSLSIVL